MKNKIFRWFMLFAFFASTSIRAQDPDLELAAGSRSTAELGPVSTATFNFLKNTDNPTANTFSAFAHPNNGNPISVTYTISNQQYLNSSVPSGVPFNIGYSGGAANNISKRLSIIANTVDSDYTYSGSVSPTGVGIARLPNYSALFQIVTEQFSSPNSTNPPIASGYYNLPTTGRYYIADLTIAFNNPLDNPVLHFAGLGGASGKITYSAEFELISSSASSGISFSTISNTDGMLNASGTKILNNGNNIAMALAKTSGSVLVKGKGITEIKLKVFLRATGDPTDPTYDPNDASKWAPLDTNGNLSNGVVQGDAFLISASLTTSDLSITKTVDNSTPNVGNNVTFNLTADNLGMSDSYNTKVTDLLPSGYTYVSSTPSVGTYDSATGIWNIGTLYNPSNTSTPKSATLSIVAKVNATGNYTNTATIAGDNTDFITTNSTASVSTTPVAIADVSITKTDNKTKYALDATTTYTVVAKNNGTTTVSATVTDAVPAGIPSTDMTYTAVATSGSTTSVVGTQTGAINDAVSLAPGGTVTYTVSVYVSPFFTGNLVNTATIALNSGTDSDPSNNTATDTNTPGIDAINDSFANTAINPTNGGVVGDLTLNDKLNGIAVDDTLINISIVNNGGVSGLTVDSNGNLSVPAGTPAGVYTITYRICEIADPTNCDTATAVFQVYADSDGDGVSDIVDLDDDNDGILDTAEDNCTNQVIIFKEDFGTGVRGTTPYTTYIYEPNTWDTATNTGGGIDDGEYAIVNAIDATTAAWSDCYWVNKTDRTGNANGRMAVYNASYTPGEFYRRGSITVPANTVVNLSFWAMNIDKANNCDNLNDRRLPKVRALILDGSGNTIAAVNTGAIPKNESWNNYLYNFNTGNNTTVQFVLINDAEGGLGNDIAIDDIQIAYPCDNDGDGIPNSLDLDSDNDGCVDALEGGNNITASQLVSSGGVVSTGSTAANLNLCANPYVSGGASNCVDSNGIPTLVGSSGQSVGDSQNNSVKSACTENCYKDAATGTALPTKHGITSLGRAGNHDGDNNDLNDWPMVRKGGYTVLESKTKGFVITRVTNAEMKAIVNPQIGMMVYNIEVDCLMIFSNVAGVGGAWRCFEVQSCD